VVDASEAGGAEPQGFAGKNAVFYSQLGHSHKFSGTENVAESGYGAISCAGAALKTQLDVFGAWDLADFVLEFGVYVPCFDCA
jgi:hypothetical protein